MMDAQKATAGAVQSVERAFDILEIMASAGGSTGVSEVADLAGLPLPTIHRLTRTDDESGICPSTADASIRARSETDRAR